MTTIFLLINLRRQGGKIAKIQNRQPDITADLVGQTLHTLFQSRIGSFFGDIGIIIVDTELKHLILTDQPDLVTTLSIMVHLLKSLKSRFGYLAICPSFIN